MNRFSDFFSDWYRPILGGKKYEDWRRDSLYLQNVSLNDKKLALEMEEVCKERGGFLTYAEYLQIDQFGKNGYHSTHKDHGFTPTFQIWPYAIFTYLSEHNIHEVIELGPGDANLAYNLFLLCEKNNFKLTWNAVEISDEFREKIHTRFDTKFKKFMGHITKTVKDLPSFKKAFIISSFCLDSIPPEIFINTSSHISYPNAVVGITAANGIVNEFILTEAQLKTRGMVLRDGIIKLGDTSFDVSAFRLSPMQRAYITIEGFKTFIDVIKKVEEPTFLVIDEVRALSATLRSDHLLPPLYLNVKNRYRFNPKKGYERAGEMLYYYPFYLDSVLSLLSSSGFKDVVSDIEPKLAAQLSHKTWVPNKRFSVFLCEAILASQKTKSEKIIVLQTPKVSG